MALYRCLIRGENFPAFVDGDRKLVGFFTTRWVRADSEEQAEQIGLEMLREDEWLRSMKPHASSKDPPAAVYFDEIAQVDDANEGDGLCGFSLFDME